MKITKENGYFLLTSIGVKPRNGKYRLGNNVKQGNFSSTALVDLLPEKPRKVFLLLTEEARKNSLYQYMEEMEIETKIVDIPDGVNDLELHNIIHRILKTIPEGSELILDVSQGFRHFPFLFFTSVLYLQSFKGVKIKGIYYGMFERKDKDEVCPFIDITSVNDMVNWYLAVKDFTEEKRSKKLAEMIRDTVEKHESEFTRQEISVLKSLVLKIREFDDFYGTGLPFGVGDTSKSFIVQFEKKKELLEKRDGGPIPLADDLLEYATDSLRELSIPDHIKTNRNWKKNLVLDMNEIERQCKIIQSYFDTGHYGNAIRLIREWIVTRCIYEMHGSKKDWLEGKVRKEIQKKLGILITRMKKGILPDEKRGLANLWDNISTIRNEIAHNEMKIDRIDITKHLDEVERQWHTIRSKINENEFWNPSVNGGKGSLLVSPLGFSKGLLYSALKKANPDELFVISSREAIKNLDEILERSEFEGVVHEPLILEDPHTGYNEIGEILNGFIKNYSGIFLEADEIIVNITGGTTTIQVLVEEISKIIERIGKEQKKVVFVDRRSTIEQSKNPYEIGEMIDLRKVLKNNKNM